MAKTVTLSDAQWALVMRALDEVLNTSYDEPPAMTSLEVAELFEARAHITCAEEEDEDDEV